MKKILSVLVVMILSITNAFGTDIIKDAVIYFDISEYPLIQQSIASGKKLQVLIGHDGWSEGFLLTKVSGSDNLYKTEKLPNWGNCTKLGFMTVDSKWESKGEGVGARLQYGYTKTDVYNVSANLSGNVTFMGNPLERLDNCIPPISYVLKGVNGNWNTGISLDPNPSIDGEFMLLEQQISNDKDAVKVVMVDSKGNSLKFYDTVKESSCSAKVSRDKDNNIKLPTGTYDFYFKDGEIYITPSPSADKYYLMGIGGKWDTGVELTSNSDKTDELMLLDQKISKANDAIKIVKKTPCGDEFFADIKVVSPVPYKYDDNGNIVLEDGTYDFYFDKTTNEIYISGYVDNAKIVHLDPKVENGYDWEADDARFAVYYYKSANDKEYGWVSAKACNGYYYAYIPAAFDSYVWCRMNPNNLENRWNTSDSEENKPVWNQTSSISYDENNTLTKLTDMNKSSYQIPYNGICGENYEDLNCTFPEAKDTVYVHINQFVDSDPCNYIFRSFEQAFAVLKTNTDICTSSKVTLGSLKEDQITFTKPVVMLVHFGPAYYRGNEKVGMSGGDISNAPAIFFRNINQNGGQPLIVRTAEPKGNRAVLVHPVIRRSTNIVFDNLDIIGDENQKDNALDIDTGEGRHNLEGLGDDFNVVPLSNTDYNITIKNCFLESFGRNCMHVVGINGIHVENNEFYTKYDFSQASHDEAEDVVDWGGTIKMINSSNIKFLRNNSEGTLATSFFIQGCQRVLLMNNVFWNDNSVVVTDLSAHGRTVANIRLVTVNDTEVKFPLQNIGIYYNTFFIRDNDKADESYKRFDFFRLGGAEEKLKVTTTMI